MEAQVVPRDPKAVAADKDGMAGRPILQTAGFLARMKDPGSGRLVKVDAADAVVLWVPPGSAAARWAITIGAATAALLAALALIVVFLRRWVLAPLAGLAADADRIAGGELEVTPGPTRAREVALVGDAMQGMARALGTALDASAAAERDRRFLVTAIAHDLRTPLVHAARLAGGARARARRRRPLPRPGPGPGHPSRSPGDGPVRVQPARVRARRRGLGGGGCRGARARARRGALRQARRAHRGGGADRAIVRGDAQALQRVLTNLLDNAVRHGRALVHVTTARENGTVTVGVVDDGPGFDADDLPHVFEPLFRGDRARGGAHAGLGLAIARRLARAHGGDVEAANAPAGGAAADRAPARPSRAPRGVAARRRVRARAPRAGGRGGRRAVPWPAWSGAP